MTQTAVLQRYLDRIELIFRQREPAWIVEYEGVVHHDALREAFGNLCARYPALRAIIHQDERGYLLQVPNDHQPEFKTVSGNEHDVLQEIGNRIPYGVARLILVEVQTRGYVAFQVNHAIIDATALGTMLHQLLQTYTDIINGAKPPTNTGHSLPLSPLELIHERCSELVPESIPDDLDTRDARTTALPMQRLLRLTPDETQNVISAARSLDISVHGLVCGAILAATRAIEATTEPVLMTCASIVDLRDRVSPKIGATETTYFCFTHRSELLVEANADFREVGKGVRDQISKAISGRPFDLYPPPGLGHSETAGNEDRHVVTVTNAGAYPTLPHPPDMRPIDVQMRAAIAHQMPIAMNWPLYGVYTYAGRLNVRGIFPGHMFSEKDVDDIVLGYTESLKSSIS